METVITFLDKYPELIYALCVCILTFIILKYFIESPTSRQKFIILFSSGLILGIIFSLITLVKLPLMILGFLSSIGFYEVGIKLIMKKLGTSYDDKLKN